MKGLTDAPFETSGSVKGRRAEKRAEKTAEGPRSQLGRSVGCKIIKGYKEEERWGAQDQLTRRKAADHILLLASALKPLQKAEAAETGGSDLHVLKLLEADSPSLAGRLKDARVRGAMESCRAAARSSSDKITRSKEGHSSSPSGGFKPV